MTSTPTALVELVAALDAAHDDPDRAADLIEMWARVDAAALAAAIIVTHTVVPSRPGEAP